MKKIPKEIDQAIEKFKKADKPKRNYTWDDTGNAERFVDMFKENTLYNFPNKDFYHYNGKFWELDTTGSIYKKIDEVVEAIKEEPVKFPKGATENEKNKLIQKKAEWVKKIRDFNRKEALKKSIRHYFPVAIEEFDADPNAFNCKNGWIDLNSCELKEHDSKKRFSKMANINYNSNAKSELWEKFLNRIFKGDQELIRFFQQLVGYTLIGGNPEQIIIFLYGNKGSNGKSVVLSVLESIFGDYETNVPAEDLMHKKNKTNGHNDTIAKLAGSRLVTSSEPDKGYSLSEGIVKQMTGKDTITVSFKGKSAFDFIPQFKIWLACNYIPTMNAGASDNSIWRRVVILPFDVQIPDVEQDPLLAEKLIAEKDAIFNWAIEGLKSYRKSGGLTIPHSVKDLTEQERKSMDVIGDFLESELVKKPGAKILISKVHELYVSWNFAHGSRYSMDVKSLSQELKARGYETKRGNQGNQLLGFCQYSEMPKVKSHSQIFR